MTGTRHDRAAGGTTAGGPGDPAGYTEREVARLLDIRLAEVRSFVRAGILTPRRDEAGAPRFSLQDLALLRTAKALGRDVPPRKLVKLLRKLREQLPADRPLSGVRITARKAGLVVRDGSRVWEPESGQTLLDFQSSEGRATVQQLPARPAPEPESAGAAADRWYERGAALEASDPAGARTAYERAIQCDPTHAAAHLNLGRLVHEEGDTRAAEVHYRVALLSAPEDPTPAFNLGVTLQDQGRLEAALEAYLRAVTLEPRHADAHFNLSQLYERLGDRVSAFRHLKAYRLIAR